MSDWIIYFIGGMVVGFFGGREFEKVFTVKKKETEDGKK